MSEPPANLIDLALRPGGEGSRALVDNLIRPLGIVHGPAAELAVENGLGEWLAGGPAAFTTVEMIAGTGERPERDLRSVRQVALMRSPTVTARMRLLSDARAPVAGLTWVRPRVLSFVRLVNERGAAGERSTKGAVQRGRLLAMQGADIVAVTASGARLADMDEIDRVVPVVEELAAQGFRVAIASARPIVMRAAARAGARLVIDASPTIDDDTLYTLGDIALPVVLRRSGRIGARPKNWSDALDLAGVVHAALESRIEMFEGAGLSRDRIIVDPGLGADQPPEENIAILHALSLFHGLGCPVLAYCQECAVSGARAGGAGAVSAKPPELAAAALFQGVQLLAADEPAEVWSAAAGFRAIAAARVDDTS